jgi:hypothetical protein
VAYSPDPDHLDRDRIHGLDHDLHDLHATFVRFFYWV